MSSTPTSPSAETETSGGAPVPSDDEERREERRADDVDERLLRAFADRDNLRKRYERQLADAAANERERVALLWLPVVDDLERALEHAADVDDAVSSGVRAVYEEALAVLARLGFARFDDVGAPFNPERHEAIGAVDVDAPPGTIAASVRPGYERSGVAVRPARVLVSQPRG